MSWRSSVEVIYVTCDRASIHQKRHEKKSSRVPKKALKGCLFLQKISGRFKMPNRFFFHVCGGKLPQKGNQPLFFLKKKTFYRFRTMLSRLPLAEGSVHRHFSFQRSWFRSLKFKFGRPMNGPPRTLVQLGEEKSLTYWESAWIFAPPWDV